MVDDSMLGDLAFYEPWRTERVKHEESAGENEEYPKEGIVKNKRGDRERSKEKSDGPVPVCGTVPVFVLMSFPSEIRVRLHVNSVSR